MKLFNPKKITLLIILFLAITLLYIISIIAFFIYNFHGHGISNDLTQWGQFGDFFAGILDPFFGFLTIVFLCITTTWQFTESAAADEKRKIAEEIYRENLIAMKNISMSLNIGQKISGLNNLLKYNSTSIKDLQSADLGHGHDGILKLKILNQKQQDIITELEVLINSQKNI